MGKTNESMGEGFLKGTWLALDTSTTAMTLALLREGTVIAASDSLSERNHSIKLLPAAQEMLASVGMMANGLNGIAVGHGPGSYTGIRIGVTVAKMLAWSLKLPLVSVSSLEALAYGVVRRGHEAAAPERQWIVPLMDARRGQAYTGLYERSEQGWRCVMPDGIRMMEQWLNELEAIESDRSEQDGAVRGIYFTGDYEGFMPLLEAFRERIRCEVSWDGEPLQAASVGALAALYGEQRRVADVHGFEPNYTQLSEPEKKFVVKPVE